MDTRHHAISETELEKDLRVLAQFPHPQPEAELIDRITRSVRRELGHRAVVLRVYRWGLAAAAVLVIALGTWTFLSQGRNSRKAPARDLAAVGQTGDRFDRELSRFEEALAQVEDRLNTTIVVPGFDGMGPATETLEQHLENLNLVPLL